MSWLGIDVGGANLKISNSNDIAISKPFPMWSDCQRFEKELVGLLGQAISNTPNAPHSLAATMTGELADCFESKQAGVTYIVDAIQQASTSLRLVSTKYYTVSGHWLDSESAKDNWLDVAAANWAALANFAGSRIQPKLEKACLIDIGSTTTDIVPIVDGKQSATGRTDTTRLANDELVYVGVGRTPISMLVSEFEFQNRNVNVAREAFATIKDALVVLGRVEESPQITNTPDGRPLSLNRCRHRLARTVCADIAELEEHEIHAIATQTLKMAKRLIGQSLDALMDHKQLTGHFVVSGEGDWLAVEIVNDHFPDSKVDQLSKFFSVPEQNCCAPAAAVAWLAELEFGN
jgi:probable H4MPT-linked C1 transfer pathway protein